MRRYQTRIRASCRYPTCDDNNIEDLTQEVFLKAYFVLAKFERRSTLHQGLEITT